MDVIEISLLSISIISFILYFLLPDQVEDDKTVKPIDPPEIKANLAISKPAHVIITPPSIVEKPKQISTMELIKMVVRWCEMNIQTERKHKVKTKIIINKHPRGKILGTYHFASKTITIYVNRHTNLRALVNTILHEQAHVNQFRSTKDERHYQVMTKRVGYFNNPYEVDAREFARKYQYQCINELQLYQIYKS